MIFATMDIVKSKPAFFPKGKNVLRIGNTLYMRPMAYFHAMNPGRVKTSAIRVKKNRKRRQ